MNCLNKAEKQICKIWPTSFIYKREKGREGKTKTEEV